MRIGLNGTPYDALASGARDRFLNLYGEVARRCREHEFLVYSPRELSLVPLFPGPVAGGARSPLSPSRPLARFLRSRRWFERRLGRDRVDLFVTDHFPVIERPGIETLLTIHDLRFLVLPGTGSALRRLYFRKRFAKLASRARVVVTVSQTIREEVIDRLGIAPERVHVVPNGIPNGFRRAVPEEVESLRARAGLPREYLLSVGVFEARKNLGMLLRAAARSEEDLPPLVLSGRGGPEEARLRRETERLGLKGRVLFIGYTREEDLPALYSGAAALLVPSRYEGFGLPVLQGFACRTPVVCARAAALPEVAGAAAILVDPDDEEAWTDAIQRVLTDETLRSRLAKAGRERADTYSWSAAATRLLPLLNEQYGT